MDLVKSCSCGRDIPWHETQCETCQHDEYLENLGKRVLGMGLSKEELDEVFEEDRTGVDREYLGLRMEVLNGIFEEDEDLYDELEEVEDECTCGSCGLSDEELEEGWGWDGDLDDEIEENLCPTCTCLECCCEEHGRTMPDEDEDE